MASLARGAAGVGSRGRIAVVGGCLGGLSAAALLLRKGFRVTVYDKSPMGPGTAHPSQLWTWWPAAWSILHQIMGTGDGASGGQPGDAAAAVARGRGGNVWHGHRVSVAVSECDAEAGSEPVRTLLRRQPIEEISSFNWKGIPIGTFPLNACNVHTATVLSALASEVSRLGGSIVCGPSGELVGLDQRRTSGVALDFADGNTAEADVVVGADGVSSRVRGLAFASDAQSRAEGRPSMDAVSGQLGAREGTIEVTSGRVNVSHRPDIISLYKPDGARVFGLGGAFIMRCYGEWLHWDAMLVPDMYGAAAEPKPSSMYAEPPPPRRPETRADSAGGETRLLREGHCERLAKALTALSWDPRIIALVRATLPQDCVFRRPCDGPQLSRWHVGRVALIGDAAHACFPYGTQGAVLALADAISVASSISEIADIRSTEAVEKSLQSVYATCAKGAHAAQQRGRKFHASLADSEDSEINIDYGFVLSV
eukprot:Opistho-1_new@81560